MQPLLAVVVIFTMSGCVTPLPDGTERAVPAGDPVCAQSWAGLDFSAFVPDGEGVVAVERTGKVLVQAPRGNDTVDFDNPYAQRLLLVDEAGAAMGLVTVVGGNAIVMGWNQTHYRAGWALWGDACRAPESLVAPDHVADVPWGICVADCSAFEGRDAEDIVTEACGTTTGGVMFRLAAGDYGIPTDLQLTIEIGGAQREAGSFDAAGCLEWMPPEPGNFTLQAQVFEDDECGAGIHAPFHTDARYVVLEIHSWCS